MKSRNDAEPSSSPANKRDLLFNLHTIITERAYKLMEKKNHDYADGDNPFKNFEASEVIGVHPLQGVLMRMQDKMSRLATAVHSDLLVESESVEDSVVDIINYAVIYLAMYDEERA